MGLKRRPKKKINKGQKDQANQKDQEEHKDQKDQNHQDNRSKGFDPNRPVKLDHKRKCFVVDEAPLFPLIATPRLLQKRFHYFSESSSDSDNNDELKSDDELETEYVMSSRTDSKEVIRVSSASSDSGFEGGGTAPANPKKMLGKKYKYDECAKKLKKEKNNRNNGYRNTRANFSDRESKKKKEE